MGKFSFPQLRLGMYSVGFLFFNFSPGYVSFWDFQNSPQTHLWEDLLLCGNISFMTSSQGWVSVPNFFVSVFIFHILLYLLLKRLGCLSGCLMSSINVQKLFCGNWSAFKWSFDEIVGEKVVSLSYHSAILGPFLCFLLCLFRLVIYEHMHSRSFFISFLEIFYSLIFISPILLAFQ